MLDAQAHLFSLIALPRWQNFELISDRPFETMLAEMKRCASGWGLWGQLLT
jgi:hypothetical protein